MSATKKKILHQHIAKSGGTSINNYIATKLYAPRVLDPACVKNLMLSAKTLLDKKDKSYKPKDILKNTSLFRLDNYDFINGHSPLVWGTNEEFFKFIILRNPIHRVISQINDWKRLHERDLAFAPNSKRSFILYCLKHNISEILDIWDTATIGRVNLNNMQTRNIAKSKLGLDFNEKSMSDTELLEYAKEALRDYELVGLTEQMDESFNRLCYLNKWCPPRRATKLNSTRSSKELDPEIMEKIRSLNELDLELYDYAVELFNSGSPELNYDLEYFEKNFAEERTKDICPTYMSNEYLFDFNMPIIGCGLHLRDSTNTPECAVWTGPENRSSLFFPVVPKTDINVLLYIKGFADRELREMITIYLDGEPREHILKRIDTGYLLIARHITTRTFVHLEIETKKTVSKYDDTRMRGLSLWKYGFTCNF